MEASAHSGSEELAGSPPAVMSLAVAPPADASDGAEPLADPRFGRSAAIGAFVGFLVCACGIALACWLTGLDIGSSIGLGVFVGMWGGAGFGFMTGGTIPLARQLDALSASSHGSRDDT